MAYYLLLDETSKNEQGALVGSMSEHDCVEKLKVKGWTNGGNNEGIFELDISGQGKVLLSYTTDPVEAIAAANEGAEMDHLIFNNVKFNRSGTFTYEMDNGAYAYRIVDGKLIEMPCCYDESEDAFVFHTNRLEAYAFAERALVNPA